MTSSPPDPKDIATRFLQMVIKGEIVAAFAQYIDPAGIHHNMYTAAGMTTLEKGMQDNELQFPSKQFSIKKVVCEGAMVVTYSHLTLEPDTAGLAVMHMFRIVEGKIVEMWDCGQALPAETLNEQGAF